MNDIRRRVNAFRQERCKRRLFGALAPLVPPVELMLDGPPSLEEFKANGEQYLDIYWTVCGLRPDENVLDVGCGIGRKTIPLTRYLTDDATYEGIDVDRRAIEWCREKITPRHPNFRFQHIDVHNKHSNPEARTKPSEYTFPFADRSFSFVTLASVFTHMLPDGVERYMSEIRRVLMDGGRCLITYFLLTGESLRFIEAGSSTLPFAYDFGVYRSISEDVPEWAVAYDESYIRRLYDRCGLEVTRVEPGSWCGRDGQRTYQDLVLARKV